MKTLISYVSLTLILCSCTTLDESLKLGAVTGSVVGATTSYVAQQSIGKETTLEDAAIGASIGLGLGLLVSYFVHDSVVEDRAEYARETEIYFGDLPPSPFIVPTPLSKKGKRE